MNTKPDIWERHASDRPSRRDFIKKTAAAAAGVSAGLMASGNFAYAAGSDQIRVGMIGCGGRGTGAARDCVVSAEGVVVTAMGDLFEDRLEHHKGLLKKAIGEKLEVTGETSFTGFDAYRQVVDSNVDLVIIASPPGFHPIHLRAAVEAGKHVFFEKPAAVDPPGVVSVIESGEVARQKGLSIVTGTVYRRQPSFVEAVQRIHDGAIGQLLSAQAYYYTGSIWLRERKPGMSDMEWQCRNWYYFTWLSGDHIVEQFVHNLDVHQWVFQEMPKTALASGGRQVRVDPSYGHIYDHFSVDYAYPGGARLEAKCRQMENAERLVTNRVIGSEGVAELNPGGSRVVTHDGDVVFEKKKGEVNPYVQEHADLVRSIREGEPLNEAEQIAQSTLMAIMGRESAYTGEHVTREQVMNADLNLVPETFSFRAMPVPPVPTPGVTALNRTLTEEGMKGVATSG